MKTKNFEMTMSDGNKNFVYQWIPDGKVESVVVISHGMAEHALRYAEFAGFLCENNCAVICEDHRGHGKTAWLESGKSEDWKKNLGCFCSDGFVRSSEDVFEEISYAKNEFPGVPVILCGHSYGSFLSQRVIELHGHSFDKAILLGTAGPRRFLMFFASIFGMAIKAVLGPDKNSKILNTLAFGSYNNRIKNKRTENDWISSDPDAVDRYNADELCGFQCSCNFMCNLFLGFRKIHKTSQMKKIPVELPVLLLAGKDDPVGDYGKTVEKLYREYLKYGMKKVEFKLYDNARHELLNEFCRKDVMDKILKFIKS